MCPFNGIIWRLVTRNAQFSANARNRAVEFMNLGGGSGSKGSLKNTEEKKKKQPKKNWGKF